MGKVPPQRSKVLKRKPRFVQVRLSSAMPHNRKQFRRLSSRRPLLDTPGGLAFLKRTRLALGNWVLQNMLPIPLWLPVGTIDNDGLWVLHKPKCGYLVATLEKDGAFFSRNASPKRIVDMPGGCFTKGLPGLVTGVGFPRPRNAGLEMHVGKQASDASCRA